MNARSLSTIAEECRRGERDPVAIAVAAARAAEDGDPAIWITRVGRDEVEAAADEPEAPAAEAEPAQEPATTEGAPSPAPAGGFGAISLAAAELADASGADLGTIAELEKMGLIEAAATDEGAMFDHEALLVAKAAVAFQGSGMELRHLRMYKVAADREVGLLHQLRGAAIAKGGAAAADARTELALLVAEGEAIHRSLLRRALGLDLES